MVHCLAKLSVLYVVLNVKVWFRYCGSGAYKDSRNSFMVEFEDLLGGSFKDFESLAWLKSSYML